MAGFVKENMVLAFRTFPTDQGGENGNGPNRPASRQTAGLLTAERDL